LLVCHITYAAIRIIRKFIEAKTPPVLMVLVVQKEVGERMCASPPNMSKLSIFTQFYSNPEILFSVSKKLFYPQPKVDSVVVKIIPKKTIIKTDISNIVNIGFSQPRKQLINNLSSGLNIPKEKIKALLKKNSIAPERRPGELTLKEWVNLAKTF